MKLPFFILAYFCNVNYQETLNYLFSRLPMFSRVGPVAFKKDLTNTLALCESLENPHKKFKCIHVAGTNGKGSVSHMLAAIFQTAGYKTGLYTSPHLYDFRERIKINGQICSEEFVIQFTEKMRPLIEKINPSFFEITVAMAFDHFAIEKVDIAIIETGLGGRLDSTNVVTPELSVITNISWDHMDMLGDSLEKIAIEKAGIIKKNTPIVIGEWLPETKQVFEKKAKEQSAPIYLTSDHFQVLGWDADFSENPAQIPVKYKDQFYLYSLDLKGRYQAKNLLTVLQSVSVMTEKGWKISQDQINKALLNVKKLTGLHGRWEVISENPRIVLDVAHNKEGIMQLVSQLEETDFENLHIIFGMVKDKDTSAILSLLPKTARYYFTQADIPRAMPASELKEKAGFFQLKGKIYSNVNEALNHALSRASGEDLVLVCGSIFLVAEVNISQLQQAFVKN